MPDSTLPIEHVIPHVGLTLKSDWHSHNLILSYLLLFQDANNNNQEMVMKNGMKSWWQQPGLGISYTVESKPGWAWNRNYKKYNRSHMDENGAFKFAGPFCKVEQFIELSKKVDADYHMLYVN